MSPLSSIRTFFKHLANDHLDMLIVDIHTLQTVYTLYFLQHVILYGTDALDLQDDREGSHYLRSAHRRPPAPVRPCTLILEP